MKKTCELKIVGRNRWIVVAVNHGLIRQLFSPVAILCLCILLPVTMLTGQTTHNSVQSAQWHVATTWDVDVPNPLSADHTANVYDTVLINSNDVRIDGQVNVLAGGRIDIKSPKPFTLRSGGFLYVSPGRTVELEGSDSELVINGATMNFNTTGILSGVGKVTGTSSFTNTGIVSPGTLGTGLGCMTFTNGFNYGTSANAIAIQIGGTSVCSGYDHLSVTGNVTLGGILNVTLKNFTPTAGQSFIIMNFSGTRSGTFTTTNFPVVPGVAFTVQYNANSVVINTQASSPLPIELKSFTATPLRNQVQLDWSTASEKDNAGFDIERSADGLAWKTLHFVEGAGTTTSERHYHFIDEKPIFGTSYYRLRQLDVGGREEFSPMVAVELKGNGPSISVYPNPVADLLHVALDQPGIIQVIDGSGRMLERIAVNEDQLLTQLNVSHYPSGIFMLRVVVGNSTKVFSFVKH